MAPSTYAATSRPPNDQGQSSWGGRLHPIPKTSPAGKAPSPLGGARESPLWGPHSTLTAFRAQRRPPRPLSTQPSVRGSSQIQAHHAARSAARSTRRPLAQAKVGCSSPTLPGAARSSVPAGHPLDR
ncbi:hypothetical protein NDU88_002568 [Pleurodeles waltl]|uniref:Uncharacterized protein n=1 Tax=Pleurodeles waltl TaxID=8319 RepID=A0AAV7TN00_PLEWA|nr:hypothetical protein NDU88_002568 [Pleurodeles waltl]